MTRQIVNLSTAILLFTNIITIIILIIINQTIILTNSATTINLTLNTGFILYIKPTQNLFLLLFFRQFYTIILLLLQLKLLFNFPPTTRSLRVNILILLNFHLLNFLLTHIFQTIILLLL